MEPVFAGLTVKAVPEQMVAVWFGITGLGLTTTTTLFVAVHPFAVMV